MSDNASNGLEVLARQVAGAEARVESAEANVKALEEQFTAAKEEATSAYRAALAARRALAEFAAAQFRPVPEDEAIEADS